jgi:hypothetical protein
MSNISYHKSKSNIQISSLFGFIDIAVIRIGVAQADYRYILTTKSKYCNINPLHSPIWQRKGGETMNEFSSFIMSVMAGIVAYIICQWFNDHSAK